MGQISSNSAHFILRDHTPLDGGGRTLKPRGGSFLAATDLTIYGHKAHRANRKWGREWKVFSTFPAVASEPQSKGGHAQTLKAEPATLSLSESSAFPHHRQGNQSSYAQRRVEFGYIRTIRDCGSPEPSALLLFPEPLPE